MRVGKLVWVRMGKVGGLIFGMMVWISRRVPQRLPAQSGLTLPYLNANECAGGIMNYSYSIYIH